MVIIEFIKQLYSDRLHHYWQIGLALKSTRYIKKYWLLAIICIFSACQYNVAQDSATIRNEPKPSYLRLLAPSPKEIISLNSYHDGRHYIPIGPDHPSGGRDSICAEINPMPLLEPGDFFALRPNQGEYFPDRVTLQLNGELMPTNGEVGIVLGSQELFNQDGEVIAEAPGPHSMCWLAEIGIGVHIATIEITKTSGEIVSYSWSFEIIDGTPPTLTPLPTPIQFDTAGTLPTHIRVVYPEPGELVILSEMQSWPDLFASRGLPVFNPQAMPVCVSFNIQELLKVDETLPAAWIELDEYIFFLVDDIHISQLPGRVKENEVPGLTLSQLGEEEIETNCAELDLTPGTHIAVSYIVPPNSEVIIYGWSFTITND